ncbi:HIV Tat-specific factor 1 homolog [Manduca sexta]|uniref:17S U2 SnRNP complex component HTATSF1 n=1 Tax=Manduca sexta TaxID=7130 RepID=A0A921YP02_MANSE|nr:HIV Tat-specific factor 1 homolog [Manduca sexta]KAG6442544.1 hypothetical protein O3G_MSEX002417 [Manduca sexta]
MARQPTSKPGFVIKLSTETVQKLAEEDQQAKAAATVITPEEVVPISEEKDTNDLDNECKSKTDDLEVMNHDNIEDPANDESDNKVKPIDSESPSNVSNDVKTTSQSNLIVKNSEKNSTSNEKSAQSDANGSWGDYAPYITYEGEEAIYTDPTSQQKYTWSKTSNTWEAKADDVPGRVYSYEDDTHIYTEADGSKYFWDVDKKAWIPKVDDDFLAYYQMSYGFVDNKTEEKKDEPEKKEVQKKHEGITMKRKSEPQWFQPAEETNTKVYVSNLPLDINEEEFVNFMQKCGLVERDPSTQKMKVKLYMDKEHNCFKGDALCTYIKIESVDLALKLLDGCEFKGHKVKVERAHFQLKGEYNPALKPKKKKKKELEKIKKMKDKLFDWRPEKFIGERSKHEKVVIIKNLFHPTDFDKEVQLILDYQQDLREECGKCGEVRKVIIYDRHPEGVAQVTMKEPEQADEVVKLINGRWFGKRQITAEIWDGRTKYKIAETDADINQRINKWEKFLEDKEDNKQEKKDVTEVKQGVEDTEHQKHPKEEMKCDEAIDKAD